MNRKKQLKKIVMESVLNFLNDANHWKGGDNFFDFVEDLPDRIEVKNDSDDVSFEVPIKKNSKETPLFTQKDNGSFGLSKKEN